MVTKVVSQEQPVGTKDAILDAASDLLSKVGYQHMTIDQVARQAGLGKGTIYIYFQSKKELALSVIDRLNVRLRERLRTILRSPEPIEARLRDMLMERIMYRFECVKNYKGAVDQILDALRPALLERRGHYTELEAVIFVEALVEGRTLGVFECEYPDRTAHALLTATAALLPYSLSPAELGSRKNLEDRAAFLIEMLVRSVTSN